MKTTSLFYFLTNGFKIYTTRDKSEDDSSESSNRCFFQSPFSSNNESDSNPRPKNPDLILKIPICIKQCQQNFDVVIPLNSYKIRRFQIIDPTTGVVIGNIVKYYGGFCKEFCTVADTFEINCMKFRNYWEKNHGNILVSPNLALQLKLLVISAALLLVNFIEFLSIAYKHFRMSNFMSPKFVNQDE